MSALSLATNLDYDRAAYIECDCLFVHPVAWAFDQMTKPYGCAGRTVHGYLENNVAFFSDLKWLREFDFVGKYDWPNRIGDKQGEEAGEYIWERILGEHLEVLPLRGGRMRSRNITAANFRKAFPDGCDFITHADADTNAIFLRQNGFADLMEHL